MKIGDYVIVRTTSAGAFAGVLNTREGQAVLLTDARRLWYWEGAASLSEMAMRGVSKPEQCKFPMPVKEVVLMEPIEIILCTDRARRSIENVPEWTAHDE
jgi:hypothetical protein